MKNWKRFAMVLVIALSAFALVACGGGEGDTPSDAPGEGDAAPAADNSLQAVLDNGVLKVGMCPEYPPYESISESNEIVGFDPSLAAAFAETLGVKVECLNTPWEGLIAGLNNGDFDVIMSAMSPEEATAATDSVELSENYYNSADILVVASDNEEIKTKEDLAGKTIGFQTGSSAEQAAEGLADLGIEVAALNPYNRTADAYAELNSGRIDAVIVGDVYANSVAELHPDTKIVNDPVHQTGITIVAKKGAVNLIDALEGALQELKDNGRYDEIVKEWLVGE